MSVDNDRVLAMVTTLLSVGTIAPDDLSPRAHAEAQLQSLDPLDEIIDELAADLEERGDFDTFHDTVARLASFAATAVEMWASASGKDPMALMKAIALRRVR